MKKFFVAIAAFVFAALLCGGAGASDDAMQKQIDQLRSDLSRMAELYEARIAELEDKLKRQQAGVKEDDAHEHCEHEHRGETPIPGECHRHRLLGDKIRPIAAVDMRFVNVEGKKNALLLHEATVGVEADITDWLCGTITFTKHHGDDVEIEEAYALMRFEELGLSAKAGKFFVNFGPENKAHFFDRRTITFSAMHDGLFGHESWADAGAQFDWKIPVDFYSKLSFSVVNGDNAESFGDGDDTVSNNNFPIVLDWANFFETEYGLVKFGPSFSWGTWDRDSKYNVYLVGGNAYYKLGNFDAQAELIYRYKEQAPGEGEENAYGYYAWGAYTFPLGYKYLQAVEFLAGFGQFIPDTGDRETRVTPQISLMINDYAKLRAIYEVRSQYPKDLKDNRFITQLALEF
jgi:hypothetical protein